MRSTEALRVLTDLTASQWGMVTSAQAAAAGVTRLMLSRLAEAGHLERLAHGVYKDAGVPSDEFEDLRAAWLSTEPKVLGEHRLEHLDDGVVVAGASAALLHGIGDLWADRHEFVSPTRRQSQRPEIRYRRRVLDVRDVTLVHGLPTMAVERTLADLVDEVGDLSLVANALGAAARSRALDLDRLRELLASPAERLGFPRNDGQAVLDKLFEDAGLDAEAVADRVAGDPVLGARVVANFVDSLDPAAFERLMLPPSAKQNVVDALELLAETLHASISPRLEAMDAASTAVVSELLRSGVLDRVGSPASGDASRSAPRNSGVQWLERLPASAAADVDHETAPASEESSHDD